MYGLDGCTKVILLIDLCTIIQSRFPQMISIVSYSHQHWSLYSDCRNGRHKQNTTAQQEDSVFLFNPLVKKNKKLYMGCLSFVLREIYTVKHDIKHSHNNKLRVYICFELSLPYIIWWYWLLWTSIELVKHIEIVVARLSLCTAN